MGFKVITGEAAVTQGEDLPVSFMAEESWPRWLHQALMCGAGVGVGALASGPLGLRSEG